MQLYAFSPRQVSGSFWDFCPEVEHPELVKLDLKVVGCRVFSAEAVGVPEAAG